jgi:hypothetical protein
MLNAKDALRGNLDSSGIVEIVPDLLPDPRGARRDYPPIAPYNFRIKHEGYKLGI